MAILFVMVGHGNTILANILPAPLLGVFVFDGVSIFFVLSGFLIGKILIDHLDKQGASGSSILNFWIRRWFRTVPTYFFVLSILILCHYATKRRTSIAFWKYYVFVQDLFTPHPRWFQEAWSLSVEEWFYLTIPLLILVCHRLFRSGTRSVPYLCIAVILLVPLIRMDRAFSMDVLSFDDWDLYFRKQVITRLDSLMFGVLGAWVSVKHLAIWARHRSLLFFTGISLMVLDKCLFQFGGAITPYHTIFSFSVFALGTLFTLPLLSAVKTGKGRLFNVLTKVSLISYSMYLLNHSLVRQMILPACFGESWSSDTPWMALIQYLSFWTLTIVGSVLLYNLVEVPTTALRNNPIFRTEEKQRTVATN